MEKQLSLEMMGICAEHSVKVRNQKEREKAEEKLEKVERIKFRLLILLGLIVSTAIICYCCDALFIDSLVTLKIIAVYESAKFIFSVTFRLIKNILEGRRDEEE